MKTLILSDLHIGSRGCNPEEILKILKSEKVDRYILVGDIIDGWLFQKYKKFTNGQIKVIRKFLKLSMKKEIIWISGNHDEFIRKFTPMEIGGIHICDEYIENGIWFCHGDLYDGIVKMRWLGKLGSVGYDFAILIDRALKKLGNKKSLSKYIKENVKGAVSFIIDFESEMTRQAKKRGCHTVICGHIHKPEDKIIDGIRYINTGDFVENRSKLIYDDSNGSLVLSNSI